MPLQDHLGPNEQLLSQCEPLYATSTRIIYYRQTNKGEVVHSLPYGRIRRIETVMKPRHRLLIAGTLAVVGGLVLVSLGFITSVLAFLAAAVLIYLGGKGRLAYYQLHADGVRAEEEKLWRADFWRSATFIATVRQIVGELPEEL